MLAGSHTFKTGVTYDLQEANGFGQQAIAGTANFSYLQTAVPGITSQTGRQLDGVLPAGLRQQRRHGTDP